MISVIIPHANSTDLLRRLLNSLMNQESSQEFEVLIICNPLNKYSKYPEWKYTFPLYWHSTDPGANRARQHGVEHSRGEILVFLDDDCTVDDSRFLEKHWQHHRQEQISGVGGRYRLDKSTDLSARVYHRLQNDWLDMHRLPQGYHVHLLGGNSSYKRDVFVKESFDEQIIFGGTESELQVRLYHSGFKLALYEDLDVIHEGRLGFSDFIKKSFKQGIGAAYIDSLHRRPAKFLFYDDARKNVTVLSALLEWCYKVSFDAGRSYFDEFKVLKAPGKSVYKGFIISALKRIFCKEFPLWRELKTLGYVIQARVLLNRSDKERIEKESSNT